jgi:hypothetical protein
MAAAEKSSSSKHIGHEKALLSWRRLRRRSILDKDEFVMVSSCDGWQRTQRFSFLLWASLCPLVNRFSIRDHNLNKRVTMAYVFSSLFAPVALISLVSTPRHGGSFDATDSTKGDDAASGRIRP